MRRVFIIFSVLFLCTISVNLYAQEVLTGKQANNIISGTELVRTSKYGGVPSYIKYRVGQEPITASYQKDLENIMKLETGLQLELVSQEEDKLGFVHYRYQEMHNGIPLEFTAWYIHSKQGTVISANGFIHKSLPNSKSPSITKTQSVQYALNHVAATTYKWQLPEEETHIKIEQNNPEATYYPSPELVYAPSGNDYSSDMYRVAYKMNIYAHEPLSRQIVYVDAISGEILNSIEQIHHTDVPGTATTGYSGTQTITSDQVSTSNYRLRETGRGNGVETYNMLQGTSYGNAVDFTDSDNNWNNVNAQFDEYATDAHWGAEMTYDYLLNAHSRNSIDNAGFKLRSYIHYDQAYNNAFWDGNRMTYGDGNGNPLVAVDIAGHEISHGLTSNSANLIYNAESGALNESFSDIFGTAVERYGRPTNWDWLLGDDLGSPIRSISNPNSFGDPDTYFGVNWASLTGGDQGGVHTNSGVQNYWFYLLSVGGSGTNDNGDAFNISGIGFDDAEDVAFRNLTVYLFPSATFADARFFAVQSAIDLFGACTPKVGQVTDAWHAVGVGSLYVPYTVADFESEITTSCSAPFTVQFNNVSVNGTTYSWNFGDGATSTQLHPSHTYSNVGSYTVTLNAVGGSCGVADTVKTNYIVISDTIPCVITLPNNGVAATQSSCSGFLYDSGGPNGNYGAGENSQVTIAPTGASSLNIFVHSFGIEPGVGTSCNYDDLKIYDGSNTSAPLIDTYCNNNVLTNFTSNSGAITIVFSSDGGLEDSGFEIEWVCNSESAAPVARFSNNIISNCTGDVSFTDESNNNPTSWLWNFGDGQSSTLQNPTHHYNTSGNFTVTLTASNAFGSGNKTKTSLIQINLETPPTTVSDTACQGSSDTLIAFSSGTHFWYDNAFSGTSIFTGDTFYTPPLTTTTTFYVEQETFALVDSVGAIDNTFGGGGYFSGDQSLVFDILNPIILKSVYVYANSPGTRIIELRSADGTILETKSVSMANGGQRISLDFSINSGTGYTIGVPVGSQPDLFRNNNGASYPYSVSNLVNITTSTAGTDFYYFFYDWYIETPQCKSPRVAVDAVIENCNPAGINDPSMNWSVSIFPNPTNNMVNITVNNLNSNSFAELNMLNSVGQLIIAQSIHSENTLLDISKLAKGIYYVQVKANDGIKIEKLVIQ